MLFLLFCLWVHINVLLGFLPVFFCLFLLCYERILSSCCSVLYVCLPRCCCCRCDCVLASVFCLGAFGPGLDYFLVKCLVPGAFLPVNYYSTTPFILLLCSLCRRVCFAVAGAVWQLFSFCRLFFWHAGLVRIVALCFALLRWCFSFCVCFFCFVWCDFVHCAKSPREHACRYRVQEALPCPKRVLGCFASLVHGPNSTPKPS